MTRYRFSYTVLDQYQSEIDVPDNVAEADIEDYIREHREDWQREERIQGALDVEIITDSMEKL